MGEAGTGQVAVRLARDQARAAAAAGLARLGRHPQARAGTAEGEGQAHPPRLEGGPHRGSARQEARRAPTLEKLVKETVAKLQKGDKIEPIMAELSEDPGSAKSGEATTSTPDAGLVEPFKNLSLRLKLGEVGVVKTRVRHPHHPARRVAGSVTLSGDGARARRVQDCARARRDGVPRSRGACAAGTGAGATRRPDPLDAVTWQLRPLDWHEPVPRAPDLSGYAGSLACKACHEQSTRATRSTRWLAPACARSRPSTRRGLASCSTWAAT